MAAAGQQVVKGAAADVKTQRPCAACARASLKGCDPGLRHVCAAEGNQGQLVNGKSCQKVVAQA
jgi:hypothetical protein